MPLSYIVIYPHYMCSPVSLPRYETTPNLLLEMTRRFGRTDARIAGTCSLGYSTQAASTSNPGICPAASPCHLQKQVGGGSYLGKETGEHI